MGKCPTDTSPLYKDFDSDDSKSFRDLFFEIHLCFRNSALIDTSTIPGVQVRRVRPQWLGVTEVYGVHVEKFTLKQISALVGILSDGETASKAFQEAVAIDRRYKENLVLTGALRAIKNGVKPEDLVVTCCTAEASYRSRPGEYQTRFWYTDYNHINAGGDVSGDDDPRFLAEHYTQRPLREDSAYPSTLSDDLSIWHPGYKWCKQVETVYNHRTLKTEVVYVFTLKKEETSSC